MHWMLVLFMGVSPHFQIVKTDLIFFSESECFAKEASWAKVTADKINNAQRDMGTIMTRDQMKMHLEFILLQNPRGTCIPTMAEVTAKG